ncbi:hypothetical protein V1477_009750 [Vespula maculifrons]|uniref:Uncharacterized protein n=1 Tax=Vespula maculifrons TaxID=7453 RepID=A0ABD2CAM3_VESMC
MLTSINEQHNCEVGILGFERRQQSGVFARLWQLLNLVRIARVAMESSSACTVKIKISRSRSSVCSFAVRDLNNSQCITEEDLDQLRCRPTSFSTNYNSSTLNFDLNRGPVFWSRRRTSKVGTKQRRGYMPKWPPLIVAQEGNYHTIELFSKVPRNSSKMVLSHILILPCCHSECSYIVIR